MTDDKELKVKIAKQVVTCCTVVNAPEKAVDAYDVIIEAEPTNPDVLMQKAAHLIALFCWEEAQKTLEQAVVHAPKHPLIIRMLGQCHMAAGRLEIAEKLLKEASELKKKTPFYPYYLKDYEACLRLMQAKE